MEKKVDDSCVTRKVAFVLCYLGDKARQSLLCLTYWTVFRQRCVGKYVGIFWQDSCPFASSVIKDLYKI